MVTGEEKKERLKNINDLDKYSGIKILTDRMDRKEPIMQLRELLEAIVENL